MKKNTEEQIKIIRKGVADIISIDDLEKKIIKSAKEDKPLIIKLGLDPTAPDIHLGHAVVLRKIKQMQDLGHRAVIIIGDFTGKIGDPTGKSKTRKPLTKEEVVENALTYQKQIFKILDRDKTEIKFNSEWLSELSFEEVLKLAATTTVARMLEREDFKKRYNSNTPIGIHEFFYPLMQGYDSIALKADIELGGTDQTFNILMGRTLQKNAGMEQQTAIFMPILEGLDGKEKMSKSLGNYIGIQESAEIMFKKVMEIPDDLIIKYYELATDEHPDKIRGIKEELDNGKNPRDVKFELAKIITRLYHAEEESKFALEYFENVFKNKNIPDEVPEINISSECSLLEDVGKVLVKSNLIKSYNEFKRLLSQGGVYVNMQKVSDFNNIIIKNGDIIKLGKKKFVKIVK
ncbi:tyrosine--tRNA ligase [Clostridium beijerinckii]|jgi:tyrosyl-tRNA synthetase (EC 6.1.1.1)|uniref:Tyrosine--tRNA ligase n=2 Tax=Clostridium beijerinckii TaxID=1520 RepID=A0AAE2RW08_CLOBE|nr:tyrosine--tRNA ligase [Clostridium beijerinckii]ABR34574.1 tyrosyl-tRNA synthetase [Clostridium beijerinckii NCIMB 8052]AIU00578.1 tyrosyl-tRNA synthetase [Clostridium beijerinckii ATCC 35702]MBF7810798.1 tyrosine--tRNA ligase [Clostridium beijerinckii]NRT24084.1 tyrosyl-tRNA synthetase [Clostridium beijerinckii]NRT68332.1 tyrosyl-tRNA synthetase [Clostridium beijerinckii]